MLIAFPPRVGGKIILGVCACWFVYYTAWMLVSPFLDGEMSSSFEKYEKFIYFHNGGQRYGGLFCTYIPFIFYATYSIYFYIHF